MDENAHQLCERNLNCSFPCNITSLLTMNCRAKAEGMLRRFGSQSRSSVKDQSSNSDKNSLVGCEARSDGIDEIKSTIPIDDKTKLISQLFDIEGLKPIHVVTSEPTLHLCLPRSRHNTQTSHSDPEQDSDMYYDFDLVSSEGGSRSGFSSTGGFYASNEKVRYCRMEESSDMKGAESGCVTLVGSPTLLENDFNLPSSNISLPVLSSNEDYNKSSTNVDLNAVSNILSSSFQLAFKSFSDDDCNTKDSFDSLPHIFKNRHKKEKRRSRQSLKSNRTLYFDKDKHHSHYYQERHYSSNKYAEQDFKTDSKSYQRKDIKKRRLKNKEKYRKNRSDHVVRSTSSESLDSSDSSPMNVFSSPIITKYSVIHKSEGNSINKIKNNSKYYPNDTANSKLPMYIQCQEDQSNCDNNIIHPSHDTGKLSHAITKIGDSSYISRSACCLSENINCSQHYNLQCDEDISLSEIKINQSHISNDNKSQFESQKSNYMEKFYKSLKSERKLPAKNMTYIDIEISDSNTKMTNQWQDSKINPDEPNNPRESKSSTESNRNVLPIYSHTNEPPNCDEQVEANIMQRCFDSANSQNELEYDVRCAVSSYDYVREEAKSVFKDYISVESDYNYSSLPDANIYLCDSNVMFRPVMSRTEGQTKVKKNAPKTQTNGVLGSQLQNKYIDNDNTYEGQCSDNDLKEIKLDDNCENHITNSNAGAVTSLNIENSELNEGLIKESLPSSVDFYSSDKIKNDNAINSNKLTSPELDTDQVSVRPKIYFNRSRKSCKNKYKFASNSDNCNKTDSHFVSSVHKNYEDGNSDKDTISQINLHIEDLDRNIIEDKEQISPEKPIITECLLSPGEDPLNEKPTSSKYYNEPSVEESLNDTIEQDEIQTLSECENTKDCEEELDEDDIILCGKFKNIMNYAEKVAKISDEDKELQIVPTEVILIDDSNLPNNDEIQYNYDHQSDMISDSKLLSELNELKLKDNQLLEAIGVEVQPPSDDSARSSCERDLSDGNDFKARIKRSSSLKCGKTPPGTPGRKKIVRFADVLGLDLADVRTFLEGVPDVPKSAFCDLEVEEEAAAAALASHSHHSGSTVAMAVSRRILTAMFQQPGALPNFLDRVRYQKVSLENVTIGEDLSVRGIVRVYNIDFQKSVFVRYTFDHWRNHHDTQANYVKGSSDGFSDRFSFLLWGSFLQCNGALVFCIRYCTKGQEFWDNNLGSNYVLQCYPAPPNPPRGRGLEGRPQNDTSVQESNGKFSYSKTNNRSFMDTPTTPTDPWMKRFF